MIHLHHKKTQFHVSSVHKTNGRTSYLSMHKSNKATNLNSFAERLFHTNKAIPIYNYFLWY